MGAPIGGGAGGNEVKDAGSGMDGNGTTVEGPVEVDGMGSGGTSVDVAVAGGGTRSDGMTSADAVDCTGLTLGGPAASSGYRVCWFVYRVKNK